MSLISVRLPDELDAGLTREAERSHRARSEVAREAIGEYLARRERERFLDAIARAAREPGEDPLTIAEKALVLDNEALTLGESRTVQEKRPPYRTRRKKR
jgi:predicted transcriptional regulator